MSRIDTRCTDPRPQRRDELALLAGGDLPPEEAARLETHAESCPACRELLAGLRESGAALALLAEDELAAEADALARVREGVRAGVARIDRTATRREEPAGLGAPPRWALAAALLVALVAAAVWLRSEPPSRPSPDASPDPPERVVERAPDPGAEDPAPVEAPLAPEEPSGAATTTPPPADRIAAARPEAEDSPVRAAGSTDPFASAGPIDPADPVGSAPDAARPPGPRAEPGTEPRITIRVVSDDPDIVFYWLVEPEENRDEETVSS